MVTTAVRLALLSISGRWSMWRCQGEDDDDYNDEEDYDDYDDDDDYDGDDDADTH